MRKIELHVMATANLHINGFYAKCSNVTGRHPPQSYLVGSKGHESAKIFYADANARYPYRTAGLISQQNEMQQHVGAANHSRNGSLILSVTIFEKLEFGKTITSDSSRRDK